MGDVLADSGFGANTGQYNPYAGYSMGGQAAFVGENLGLQAGVVGLNALAQKAYKWGNSFSQGKSSRSRFGRYPASYVQRGTLGRYMPRKQLRATRTSQATGPSNVMGSANISPAFVAQSKEVEQMCAKWQQINVEEFLNGITKESEYTKKYSKLPQEAAVLVEYRRQALVLLKNPHDPTTEEQLKHLSQEAYMAASKIDLIILKMVTKEVETNKEGIVKGFDPEGTHDAGKFAPDVAALDEDDEDEDDAFSIGAEGQKTASHSSEFNKKWLEERQKYLKEAVLIWYNRFRKKIKEGDKVSTYEINWDRSDPFLQEGHNAWVEAIATETFIKEQLGRYKTL